MAHKVRMQPALGYPISMLRLPPSHSPCPGFRQCCYYSSCFCCCCYGCCCCYYYHCCCPYSIWFKVTEYMLPLRGPDLGTPPDDQRGHYAAYMHTFDPTRTQCKKYPTGCKQPGIYKPCLPKQPARWGLAVPNRPLPFPKGGSPQWGRPIQGVFICQV